MHEAQYEKNNVNLEKDDVAEVKGEPVTYYPLSHHITTYAWVNIGSGDGLLPDNTKAIAAAMLTLLMSFSTLACDQFPV